MSGRSSALADQLAYSDHESMEADFSAWKQTVHGRDEGDSLCRSLANPTAPRLSKLAAATISTAPMTRSPCAFSTAFAAAPAKWHAPATSFAAPGVTTACRRSNRKRLNSVHALCRACLCCAMVHAKKTRRRSGAADFGGWPIAAPEAAAVKLAVRTTPALRTRCSATGAGCAAVSPSTASALVCRSRPSCGAMLPRAQDGVAYDGATIASLCVDLAKAARLQGATVFASGFQS